MIRISRFNSALDGKHDDAFNAWPDLLALIKNAFSYMEGRVNPPSSMHRLTVQNIEEKANSSDLLLAWEGSRLVGCVFANELDDALYIGKLAVDPTIQKKGIGKQLMQACRELAIKRGKPELELETRIELLENHAFFAAQGFRKTGESAHEGFDSPTSITMRCRLP